MLVREEIKMLMLVSAIDLSEPLGGTLPWWQLFKSLNDLGIDVIVVPFIGKRVETPWWRCYHNPALNLSKMAYSTVKGLVKGRSGRRILNFFYVLLNVDKLVGDFIGGKWFKLIRKIFQTEKNINVVIAFSLPIKPLESFFRRLRSEYDVPIVYFEADMPEVLPEYNTFGYTYYHNVDLSIFDGFISNSEGVTEILKELRAVNIFTLHYAVDPNIYKPFPVRKSIDVLFSGAGIEGRRNWIEKMVFSPARRSKLKIAVSGKWRDVKMPENVLKLGYVPFNIWLKTLSLSKINLNISRFAHANVPGTSTYRIFELCGAGCCVVTNPHKGIEKWYEPKKEIYVLSEDEDSLDVYLSLLSDEDQLQKMGQAARKRTLKEHTYRHRAISLLEYLRARSII